MMQEEQSIQVARCTKIISPNTEDAKYVINVKQIAKFVVGLGDKVSPTDIEEGMRVGVDRNKYQIQIPLPPKIDPSVTMMTVEEKPDVTYSDVGGCKVQIEKMREVVELPMLHPEKFVKFGIDPPRVFSAMVLLVLGKHCLPEQLQIVQMHASFVLLVVSLFRSMLVRGLEWFVICFRWHAPRRPALCSSTK